MKLSPKGKGECRERKQVNGRIGLRDGEEVWRQSLHSAWRGSYL